MPNKSIESEIEEILYDYWAKHRYCKDGCQHPNQGEEAVNEIKNLIQKEVKKARVNELERMPLAAQFKTREKHFLDRLEEIG